MMLVPWLLLGSFVLVTAASFWYLQLNVTALVSADSGHKMLQYVAGFFPPELAHAFLARLFHAGLETLAISAIGTLLAAAAGLALGLPASGRFGLIARALTRLLLNFLRSIPELVWAALMVIAAGLGPFAGTLALALHTSGVLGRLFAETLENAPATPTAALQDSGSSTAAAFLYGTLPSVMPQLVSYVLYRWENNIRMAAVLGVVGAGGLGQMLFVSLSLFKQAEASTLIIAMLVLVAGVDGLSAVLRRMLGRSGG